MRKRKKCIICGGLFALSFLVGIPGCVHRTGTLFCDTRVSLYGPDILVNGTNMWGGGFHRDSFSTAMGSFLTLRLLLFSWWWDTLCIPYDIYLKFDGVNFYVYDQDGNPIPDVLISACGNDSFFEYEGKTDANGRFYYPRRVKSFSSLVTTRDGYWGGHKGGVWLRETVNSGLPPMLRAEFRGHAIDVPTTNSLRSLNIFMKKIPQSLPVADSYHLVVSNVVSGVEYGIDLSKAELYAPFGAGKSADVKVRLVDEEISPGKPIRSSLNMGYGCSNVLHMNGDGGGKWPYLYYVPPLSAFGISDESSDTTTPVLMKLSEQDAGRQRYAIIAYSGISQYRQQGSPAYIYLRYWVVDASNIGSLVCDYWSRKVDKVLVPATEETTRETGARTESSRPDFRE